MTGGFAPLLRQQLVSLVTYLRELESFVAVDEADYLGRPAFRRASERMVQIVVECTIDTAEAIVEAAGRPPPPTARAAFGELRELGVLGADTAALFARKYVGLRNRIVHDYEVIDSARVQDAGRHLVEDARRFVAEVSAWVDRQAPA